LKNLNKKDGEDETIGKYMESEKNPKSVHVVFSHSETRFQLIWDGNKAYPVSFKNGRTIGKSPFIKLSAKMGCDD